MKIFIDFDCTLNNLVEIWTDWINEKYSQSHISQDIVTYRFFQERYGEGSEEYWRNKHVYRDFVRPLPGAQEFVETIEKRFGKNNVFIITMTPHISIQDKNNNLYRFFNIPRRRIVHTKDKWNYTNESILIDDYPKHNALHLRHNKNAMAILFNKNNEYGWAHKAQYRDEYPEVDSERWFDASNYEQILTHLGGKNALNATYNIF